jgi:hypothetical protein
MSEKKDIFSKAQDGCIFIRGFVLKPAISIAFGVIVL